MTTCWYFPAQPLSLPLFSSSSLSISWPRNTWILSERGNVGICGRHGKNKQSCRSVRQQWAGASGGGVGEKRANTSFFNQGPASLKIFIHYFSLSASKIYLGIEELTSNTAEKNNPLRLRCSLFDEKQQRIQACFPSKDTFKSVLKNYTDASQNSQQFLKQVDITSYSQNHNNLVVLPGSNILHLFSI